MKEMRPVQGLRSDASLYTQDNLSPFLGYKSAVNLVLLAMYYGYEEGWWPRAVKLSQITDLEHSEETIYL